MTAGVATLRTTCAVVLLVLVGCGTATVGGGGSPARATWVGSVVRTPDGGQLRTTIYYGPWQCSAAFLSRCESKCSAQGLPLMGCMWLADIKGDWQGRYLFMPAEAGGRLAITHCCCDYPTVADPESLRKVWSRSRIRFREEWAKELGTWPNTAGRAWPGHHLRDFLHGGDPTAPGNILPVPDDVHTTINAEYPACYAPGGKWLTPGPERPYAD
jgi:hypothetical protein